MRTAILATMALVLVLGGSIALAPGASAAAAPPPLKFTYTVISVSAPYCATTNLASIKNTTGRDGVFTVGQQIGSSYTISGTLSISVGDKVKLSSTIGYSATASKTVSASGTFTLHPGETLALRAMYTKRYFKETSNWPATHPTRYGWAYQPMGTLCVKIY